MNRRTDFPVVLVISSLECSDAFRDELVGLLADYPVVAIHELDSSSTRWTVSFGETAWTEDRSFSRLSRGIPVAGTFRLSVGSRPGPAGTSPRRLATASNAH